MTTPWPAASLCSPAGLLRGGLSVLPHPLPAFLYHLPGGGGGQRWGRGGDAVCSPPPQQTCLPWALDSFPLPNTSGEAWPGFSPPPPPSFPRLSPPPFPPSLGLPRSLNNRLCPHWGPREESDTGPALREPRARVCGWASQPAQRRCWQTGRGCVLQSRDRSLIGAGGVGVYTAGDVASLVVRKQAPPPPTPPTSGQAPLARVPLPTLTSCTTGGK